MWPTSVGVLLLCVTLANGANFSQEEAVINALLTTEPEDFGNYLLERLSQDDARLFLSKTCFLHIIEYAKGLLGIKLWALQMFDAMAKPSSGLLRGHGAALGTFDQCLRVKAENTKQGTFRGKYCLGGFPLLNLTAFDGISLEGMDEPQSRLINFRDTMVYIPWGFCLPDACSARDFRVLTLFLMRVSEDDCQTEESQHTKFDNGDIAAISVLGVICALIVLSTTYDAILYYTKKEPGIVLLRAFSLKTNVYKITTVKNVEDDFHCLHGVRAISMLMLTFGYRFLMYAFAPLINWLDLFRWLSDKNKAIVIDAIIAADSFFILSGMLVVYNYLRITENGGKFNIIVFYLNRIIRLTPALAVAVLLHATLIRHFGSGPIWHLMQETFLVNTCREHWWSSLLYVQNYVNPGMKDICLIQSWQLSVDMQLFILSPLLLYPLRRFPKFTFGAIGGLLACSMISPFLAGWVYQLKAVIASNRSLRDVENYLEHYFFPLHTRASPWLIGFILGYIVYQIKHKKLEINLSKGALNTILISLWAISGGLMAFAIVVGIELIGHEYHWLPHALHLAFIRPVWSLAISWIILACVCGYGGPVNQLLSAPVLQVVSRISYSTYLVNITVMMMLTYQTRVGLEFSGFDAAYRYFGDIIFTLAAGFLWALAFESPMIVVSKVLFGETEEKSKKENSLEHEGNNAS